MALFESVLPNVWLYIASGILSAMFFRAVDKWYRATFWFPGVTFGLLFGFAHFRILQYTIAYSILSGIIYFIAVNIVVGILLDDFSLFGSNRNSLTRGGVAAGTFGALGLTLILKLFVDVRLSYIDIITIFSGGALGSVILASLDGPVTFTGAESKKFLADFIRKCSIFIVWQVPVALLLSFSIRFQPLANPSSEFMESIKEFLLGPIVQLIGLIASIYALVGLFAKKKE